MESSRSDRYVFISDGERFHSLVKIAVRPSGIYLVDPSTLGSGHVSYHTSGAFNLGQPEYEPTVLRGQLEPPEAVHGYQYLNRRVFNSHGFRELLAGAESPGPSSGRPGPIVDINAQPAGTRFLEVEVGVRCLPSSHNVADSMFPALRFLREETPIGSRLLVVSASWVPLFGFGLPPDSR
jgi:hypothetical protein